MDGIASRKYLNDLLKELFRKSIHLCSGLIPFLLSWNKLLIQSALATVLILYCIAEILRLKGINVPVFSKITETAARKRDQGKFVLGPVTLASGILCASFLYDERSAAIGIYALAFGDGLASLVGKFAGRCVLPYSHGKTVAGSLACFGAILCTSIAVTGDPGCALLLAVLGTAVELLPLRDFDNLLIPILLGAVAQFVFLK